MRSVARFCANEFLRLFLPSACVVCGGGIGVGERVASCCRRCWDSLPRMSGARCRRCAMPWPGHGEEEAFVCLDCSSHDSPLEWIDSWGTYDRGLVDVMQAFKFRGHDFLDAPLAALMSDAFEARGDATFDAVVPVPMHQKRVRARGYNQAELLARRFARRSGIALRSALLRKVEDTQAQSSLEKSARAANVRRAFSARQEAKGRSILLVDDVCTTGETLRACAVALKRAGARRVAAITVARAV